jgi:glutamate-1-semialdehyde 2,1-aminomutase
MVFIIDETGTMRASKGGLQVFYNVDPDLTDRGKLIGGVIPTGAVGGKKEIMDICLDEAIISGTHHAHPMACAAGIATLEQLDDAAYNYLNGMAARIKKELNAWAEKMGYPFAYFGTNSLMGYTISREKVPEIVSVRDYWDTTDENAMLVYALEMAMRGYYPVARGQISLNLPTTEEDITNLIEDSNEVITNIFE